MTLPLIDVPDHEDFAAATADGRIFYNLEELVEQYRFTVLSWEVPDNSEAKAFMEGASLLLDTILLSTAVLRDRNDIPYPANAPTRPILPDIPDYMKDE